MAWAVKTLMSKLCWLEQRSNRATGSSNPNAGYCSSQFVITASFTPCFGTKPYDSCPTVFGFDLHLAASQAQVHRSRGRGAENGSNRYPSEALRSGSVQTAATRGTVSVLSFPFGATHLNPL